MGLEIMFEAFQDEKKEKNYNRLPGLEDLSDEQSFFLSFAKVCITDLFFYFFENLLIFF